MKVALLYQLMTTQLKHNETRKLYRPSANILRSRLPDL